MIPVDSAAASPDDANAGVEADDVDHKPWTRTGATLCKHRDTFYLFGGSVVRDSGRKSMELFVLCTDSMSWRRQATTGDGRPVARSDHCAVIDPDTERLIIFGGRSQVSAPHDPFSGSHALAMLRAFNVWNFTWPHCPAQHH